MITAENEQVLKMVHPQILEFIRLKEEAWLNENLTVAKAKNGHVNISLHNNDQHYYFHSQYDPIKEADRFVDQFAEEYSENKHVLFYGFGLGYYVDAFFRRFGKIAFSIFDPYPAVFYSALVHMPADKLHLKHAENIYLENHAEYYMDNFVSKIRKEVLIVAHPVYVKILEKQYKNFLNVFKSKLVGLSLSIGVNYSFEKLWIANCEFNFQKILSTPSILREKKEFLKAQTVIMVAAGPSLQDEIEHLRYIKEHRLAYIFAVGSAYRGLTAKGIKPDAVCSYDPGLDNYEVFEDMVNQGISDIPLIFGSSVGYQTLQIYPGPMLHMITSQDRLSAFYFGAVEFVGEQRAEVISDASTIAVLTFEILNKLGCSQIILVGQNFAFRNDQYYSEGISYSFRSTHVTEREIENSEEVDCVDGGKVRTVPAHSIGRKTMENYIFQMPNMKVINTTRGGAVIAGTQYMHLEEVIKNELIEPVVQQDWYRIPTTRYNIESITAQHEILSAAHKTIESIIKSIVKTIRRLETAAALQDLKTVQNIFAKFELLNLELYNNCYYEVIIQPMIRVQYALLQQVLPTIKKEQSLINKAKLVVQHYGAYIHVCQLTIRDNEPFYQAMAKSVVQYLEANKAGITKEI